MSKKPFNLSWLFFISIVSVSIGSYIVLSVIILGDEYFRFMNQIQTQKEKDIAQIKIRLESEVKKEAVRIKFQRATSEEMSKAEIKAKVTEAAVIASHLYNVYKSRLPLSEIQDIVRESLRKIRFFNGRGYFFAVNFSGKEELFADKPELEGLYLTDQIDSNGQSVVLDMIKLGQEKGEGYYQYTWTKPGATGNNHAKIAYLKAVPELQWVIGSGDYLEDVGSQTKNQMIGYLRNYENSEFGYLLGATYDGISLFGPQAGTNILDVQDQNGLYMTKESIAKAKAGGGFIEYSMPADDGSEGRPKIGYVEGIPDWNFYISYSLSTDQIEKQVTDNKNSLILRLWLRALVVFAAGCGVLAIAIVISRKLSWRFRRENGVFLAAFETALNNNTILDKSNLRIQEYVIIAELINRVLEKKQSTDEDLRQALAERSILLKEIHHRVKNNFQAMASLFSLQASEVDDPKIRQYLEDAKNRVYSMASVHELFYQSVNFRRIALREYLEGIVHNVFDNQNISNNRIALKSTIGDILFTIEEAVPLGLILNELLTNSCKYAFPEGRSGEISIVVLEENGLITMEYSDNGVGCACKTDNPERKGFGFELVEILSLQLQAKCEMEIKDGFRMRLYFKQREIGTTPHK